MMAGKAKKKKSSREIGKGKARPGFGGIQMKLIAAFMIPVMLFILTGMLIYNLSSKTLTETYEGATHTSVKTLNEYFMLGFENIELMTTRLSVNSAVSSYYTGAENKTESMLMNVKLALNNEAVADKFIDHIIIISKNGTACSEQSAINGELYEAFLNSEEGAYVEENIGTGNLWLSSHPSLDALTGYDTDSYALSLVSVLRNTANKPIGYIVIDVKKSFIQNILDDADISNNCITGFVLEDGAQVISGSDKLIFADAKFYQAALASSEMEGESYVSFNGQSYLFAYSKLEGTGQMICALVPKSEIISGAQVILRYTMLAVCACALIAIVVGSILARGIAKSIRKVNRVLKKTSEGDLTGVITMKRKDEFRVLASSISHMMGNMKSLIGKMTTVSYHVSDSAVAVNSNSQLLLGVTRDINSAVDEINSGIVQQSKDTEDCVHQMSALADKISDVHQSANKIDELADTTKAALEEGMTIVQELGNKVTDTTNITKNIITEINELNRESAAISTIIETINEIAEQTNLLSLNASIEAARAGEAGKGFAVVSTEIRKLADQSGDAGNRIGEIIRHIQERMLETIQVAGKAEDIVEEQSYALDDTVKVFEKINGQVSSLGEDVEHILNSLNHIEAAKDDTMCAIESISATSNQTESASAELGTSMEKQLRAVEVLSQAVGRLQEDSTDLDKTVSVFIVE